MGDEPKQDSAARGDTPRKLPRVVWATAWVSFFTDLATEMVFGVLPAFYTATLRLGVQWMGFVEAAAETIASLTKVYSGQLSDRTGRRKWWMLAGYGLSAVSKPALVLTSGPAGVLFLRWSDRFGKGIRGAPRDALISRVVDSRQRGRAFGVQRAMDHSGALLGGLLASSLLYFQVTDLHGLLLLCAIPGAVAVATVLFFVREPDATEATARAPVSLRESWRRQTPELKRFLAIRGILALGTFPDLLLLKLAYDRLIAAGFDESASAAALPLLWAALHLVKANTSAWGGTLADRHGSKLALGAGWGALALSYFGFVSYAIGGNVHWIWLLFAFYGLHHGLSQGPERALVTASTPDASIRGGAFGLYHATLGIAALPAGILAGVLWQTLGPAVAFGTGAVLSALATGLFVRSRR